MIDRLWQVLPDPGPTTFTGQDKWVALAMFMAVFTPTWLAWWNARVARKHTKPHNGTSMADSLSRLEVQSDRIETKVDVHKMELDKHRDEMQGVKRVIREFRGDLDQVMASVTELQEAQTHRRETIQTEEGTSQ